MDRDESVTRSLLVGLSDDGLEEVLSAFQSRSYQAGEMIVEVGESGDELFLLAAGKVRVWSGDGPSVVERTLSVLGPGEHFGEASVIAGGPRTATVTAVTYVETLVLSGDDYRRLVKDYPQLLENLSRSLTRRLSNMNVSTTAQTSKRGVHSLAIVVDHESGWPLAENLIVQLRRNQQLVQPLLACDGALPIEATEFDRDAIAIRTEELGYVIAERSARALAVTVACGERATEAATRESNRVIFVVDAAKGPSETRRSSSSPFQVIVARLSRSFMTATSNRDPTCISPNMPRSAAASPATASMRKSMRPVSHGSIEH